MPIFWFPTDQTEKELLWLAVSMYTVMVLTYNHVSCQLFLWYYLIIRVMVWLTKYQCMINYLHCTLMIYTRPTKCNWLSGINPANKLLHTGEVDTEISVIVKHIFSITFYCEHTYNAVELCVCEYNRVPPQSMTLCHCLLCFQDHIQNGYSKIQNGYSKYAMLFLSQIVYWRFTLWHFNCVIHPKLSLLTVE